MSKTSFSCVLMALLLDVSSAGTVLRAYGDTHRSPYRTGRALLQSPGAYGDTSTAADPWGTAGGYYDPYGPGYIPGFINVDVSKEYGSHVDVGPVAVDLTTDYAGFAVANAVGVGIARDGRGFNVQLGNGNIMDLSVTKDSGFGLWLLNGLVNINLGPDGRWNVVRTSGTTAATATTVASAVTVQGIQDAAAKRATAASTAPATAQAAAAKASTTGRTASTAASAPATMAAQKTTTSTTAAAAVPTAAQTAAVQAAMAAAASVQPPSPSPAAPRKPCEGGVIVKVEGTRYTCKYKKTASPTQ